MKNRRPAVVLLAAGLAFFLSGLISGRAATFTTIVTNGPVTNRVNVVFFSEGYLGSQQGQFLVDATNAARFFLSAQPYAEYSNYFNVFAIGTNSAHTGSTHLISQTYVPGYTCFNSTYDGASDYIITIPPDPSDANSSHGQSKIDALLQTYLPATNYDLPVVLVNDPISGGSDNYGRAAITSIGNVSYILVHESGHTLGGLGDEYSDAYPGFPDVEEPNTTTNTNFLSIKWNAWIPTNTPIPTPFTGAYATTVGLFQGAHYHSTGWYRPYEQCCMQSFGAVFCPVCQEALVLAIYQKIRPLQAHSPPTNSLNITSAQRLAFSLNLLSPATHALSVQWRTNGVAVVGATNPIFNIWPSQLGNGTQKVEADAWDGTDLVRKDVKNLLRQTNIWTLNQSLPTLQIDSLKWLTNGSLTLRVTGASPDGVVIQSSSNLLQWTSVQTNFLNGGKLFYTNPAAAGFLKNFYRATTPP